jgi:hypothetical protein
VASLSVDQGIPLLEIHLPRIIGSDILHLAIETPHTLPRLAMLPQRPVSRPVPSPIVLLTATLVADILQIGPRPYTNLAYLFPSTRSAFAGDFV